MQLNQVFSFDDLRSAKRFSRAQAEIYKERGLIVENFNGHDWIWYAVDLSDDDKGIILQIFNHNQLEGGVLT